MTWMRRDQNVSARILLLWVLVSTNFVVVIKLLYAKVPSGPTHQDDVNAVIATLSIDNLKADLEPLTAYNNRYYEATTGAQAANDLVAKLKTVCLSLHLCHAPKFLAF
jgi:bacterial leucyl aminopeptidase